MEETRYYRGIDDSTAIEEIAEGFLDQSKLERFARISGAHPRDLNPSLNPINFGDKLLLHLARNGRTRRKALTTIRQIIKKTPGLHLTKVERRYFSKEIKKYGAADCAPEILRLLKSEMLAKLYQGTIKPSSEA